MSILKKYILLICIFSNFNFVLSDFLKNINNVNNKTINISNCFIISSVPKCTDLNCQKKVCKFDNYCCTIKWDNVCVAHAIKNCDKIQTLVPTTMPNYTTVVPSTIPNNITTMPTTEIPIDTRIPNETNTEIPTEMPIETIIPTEIPTSDNKKNTSAKKTISSVLIIVLLQFIN